MDSDTILLRMAAEWMRDALMFASAEIMEAASAGARRPGRRHWTHPYLRRRVQNSLHRGIFNELALEDPARFRRCLRMDEEMFTELLSKVEPLLQKRDTHLRAAIPASERLSITLRYLATGETQESLRAAFRVGQSTVSGIVREGCSAIFNVLRAEFLRLPSCEEEWRNVANGFSQRWGFPHCLGAMDGKHVKIEAPTGGGSLYYNYKDFHSIVLLAAVDADLRFVYIDVGTNGRISDSGIWANSDLKNALENNSIHVPPPEPVEAGGSPVPYVFIADQGLPLHDFIMIPYPPRDVRNNDARRIYNYRLCRARVTSENAFGVLASRFLMFGSALRCDPDEACRRVRACLALHNWLRTRSLGRDLYTPPTYRDTVPSGGDMPFGELSTGRPLVGVTDGRPSLVGNRRGRTALNTRNAFCDYFNSEAGSIPEQAGALYRPSIRD